MNELHPSSPGDVWYAIPSASPARCRETLPVWRKMGYRVAVLQNRERGEIPADLTEWADEYPGWAASVNLLAAQLVRRGARLVVTGGDDMLPDRDHLAADIAREFHERFPDGFGVMQPTGDEVMNTAEYCGSPWLGRGWIERAYGGHGPLWPGYTHNWADLELALVAERLGVLWRRDDLRQEHRHFSITGERTPDYWAEQVAPADRDDVELLIARRLQGFPQHAPVGRPPVPRGEWDRAPGPAERYWFARYAGGALQSADDERMAAALRRCAEIGARAVLIYGAGSLARACAASLCTPPVRVLGMIDDDGRTRGTTLWGYPVWTAAEAPPADAVVLAARTPTAAMRASAERLAPEVLELVDTHEKETVRA